MNHAAKSCVRGAAFAILMIAAPQAALAAGAETPDEAIVANPPGNPKDEAMAALGPGQYAWTPDAVRASGPVTVVVSIPLQVAWVFRGDAQIGVSSVSTGKAGHDTPTGSFSILQKAVHHRSNLYNSAPMPYMQRLTWDGVALHAGHVTGQPASHGCVRLPLAFAQALYKVTSLGATVVITDRAPSSTTDALAAAFEPTNGVPATLSEEPRATDRLAGDTVAPSSRSNEARSMISATGAS